MRIRRKLTNIVLGFIFLAGLSLMLYPSVSEKWNSFHQSRVVASYVKKIAQMGSGSYEAIKEEAKKYNDTLSGKSNRFILNEEEAEIYYDVLDPSGNGVMGYLEIPSIRVKMAVYHGTEESTLQVGAGHFAGSSLPIGGEGTHCVISGHRGLPSARLFTDLDKVEIGDVFQLQVLADTLTYEVDQIRIVTPKELDDLEIEEEKDYCTLVTCTPYGINTHRLLVRGTRIENPVKEQRVHITTEAQNIEMHMVLPAAAIPFLILFLVLLFVDYRKNKIVIQERPEKCEGGDHDETI